MEGITVMRVMGWGEVINVYGDRVCVVAVAVLVKTWVAVWEMKVGSVRNDLSM